MRALDKARYFVWGEPPKSKMERNLLLKLDWFILSYCCLMVSPVTSMTHLHLPNFSICAVFYELYGCFFYLKVKLHLTMDIHGE